MEIVLELDGKEKTELRITRNWFTGEFLYTVNGKSHFIKNPMDLGTHFSLQLNKEYNFEVGEYQIKIKHSRPQFFAGFRPHTYQVYVNGELRKIYKGL